MIYSKVWELTVEHLQEKNFHLTELGKSKAVFVSRDSDLVLRLEDDGTNANIEVALGREKYDSIYPLSNNPVAGNYVFRLSRMAREEGLKLDCLGKSPDKGIPQRTYLFKYQMKER